MKKVLILSFLFIVPKLFCPDNQKSKKDQQAHKNLVALRKEYNDTSRGKNQKIALLLKSEKKNLNNKKKIKILDKKNLSGIFA